MLIVTGMSGAGRSTAANALEDLDWYVVDNLPPQMLKPLLDLTELAGGALPRVAVVVDVRGRDLFADLPEVDARAARTPADPACMFLDAVGRRARPPVRGGAPAAPAAGRRHDPRRHPARARAPGRACARAPTSSSTRRRYNIHQLATQVAELFSEEGAARHTLTILSFGFKYGLPPDADLVADMRFLPNPFWNEDLRALTGEDDAVRDYVLEQEGAREFIDAYAAALRPGARGLPAREQAALGRRDRLHRRQAPLGRRWRASSPSGSRPSRAWRCA